MENSKQSQNSNETNAIIFSQNDCKPKQELSEYIDFFHALEISFLGDADKEKVVNSEPLQGNWMNCKIVQMLPWPCFYTFSMLLWAIKLLKIF